MRYHITAFLLVCISWVSCGAQSNDGPATKAEVAVASSVYVPVHAFDAKRNAAADIRAAILEAQRTHKRVLLYVGADWCMYCDQMNHLFGNNPGLLELRDSRFVTVKVYYGPDQDNAQALSPYTKLLGIPHLLVLVSDGALLHSQHVLDLRANGEYSPAKFRNFLQRWAR